MKKSLKILLFLIPVWFVAQNQQFIYEYKFVVDSTHHDRFTKELMMLKVDENGSEFYSYDKFKADSISEIDSKRQIALKSNEILLKNSYKGNNHYRIVKIYPDFKIYNNDFLGGNDYRILDTRKIIWKILPETEVIGTYKTQKAETKMYGRLWTAWFTTDIPIQDGPYKFHGLPGIIVKLKDKTHSHQFELKSVSNFYKEYGKEIENGKQSEPSIEISQDRYKKLFWENRKDPAKSLKIMIQQNPTFKIIKDGVEVSAQQMIKNRENSAKENQKTNNNFLELDLLKE